MSGKQHLDDDEPRVRRLAVGKGFQLHRTDGAEGIWHLVNPLIDAKTYGFAFMKPHTFTLTEIEELMSRRPDCEIAPPYKLEGG